MEKPEEYERIVITDGKASPQEKAISEGHPRPSHLQTLTKMKSESRAIAGLILERRRQDEMYPDQAPGIRPEMSRRPDMIDVIVEEVGEVSRARMEGSVEEVKRELLEVAASALKYWQILDLQDAVQVSREVENG